jgi:hypothetical protein
MKFMIPFLMAAVLHGAVLAQSSSGVQSQPAHSVHARSNQPRLQSGSL